MLARGEPTRELVGLPAVRGLEHVRHAVHDDVERVGAAIVEVDGDARAIEARGDPGPGPGEPVVRVEAPEVVDVLEHRGRRVEVSRRVRPATGRIHVRRVGATTAATAASNQQHAQDPGSSQRHRPMMPRFRPHGSLLLAVVPDAIDHAVLVVGDEQRAIGGDEQPRGPAELRLLALR